jgi:hypothetical protein
LWQRAVGSECDRQCRRGEGEDDAGSAGHGTAGTSCRSDGVVACAGAETRWCMDSESEVEEVSSIAIQGCALGSRMPVIGRGD